MVEISELIIQVLRKKVVVIEVVSEVEEVVEEVSVIEVVEVEVEEEVHQEMKFHHLLDKEYPFEEINS